MGRDNVEEQLVVAAGPDRVFEAVCEAFTAVGSVKRSDHRFRRVEGRVFAGTANMNKAVVSARVEAEGSGSRVVMSAVAREGLVNQGTATGAIGRLIDALPGDLADPNSALRSLMPTETGTAEGWLPDPSGRYPDRWWDGKQWTHWVRDKPGGTRSEDPPVPSGS